MGLWARDQSGYWQQRWVSQDIFRKYVAATASNDSAFMLQEIDRYWNSETYLSWRAQHPLPHYTSPPPVDAGDYWAITFGGGIVEGSFVADDYGNWYIRLGQGVNTGGWSASRGDILVNTDPEGLPFQSLVDIDALNLSPEDKKTMARQAMTGWSMTAGGTYFVGVGGSSALRTPYHASIEANVGAPGFSVTMWSYTFNVDWSR